MESSSPGLRLWTLLLVQVLSVTVLARLNPVEPVMIIDLDAPTGSEAEHTRFFAVGSRPGPETVVPIRPGGQMELELADAVAEDILRSMQARPSLVRKEAPAAGDVPYEDTIPWADQDPQAAAEKVKMTKAQHTETGREKESHANVKSQGSTHTTTTSAPKNAATARAAPGTPKHAFAEQRALDKAERARQRELEPPPEDSPPDPEKEEDIVTDNEIPEEAAGGADVPQGEDFSTTEQVQQLCEDLLSLLPPGYKPKAHGDGNLVGSAESLIQEGCRMLQTQKASAGNGSATAGSTPPPEDSAPPNSTPPPADGAAPPETSAPPPGDGADSAPPPDGGAPPPDGPAPGGGAPTSPGEALVTGDIVEIDGPSQSDFGAQEAYARSAAERDAVRSVLAMDALTPAALEILELAGFGGSRGSTHWKPYHKSRTTTSPPKEDSEDKDESSDESSDEVSDETGPATVTLTTTMVQEHKETQPTKEPFEQGDLMQTALQGKPKKTTETATTTSTCNRVADHHECESDCQCSPRSTCRTLNDNMKTCEVKRPGLGAKCSDGLKCEDGFKCEDRKCKALAGATCSEDSECMRDYSCKPDSEGDGDEKTCQENSMFR